MTQTQKPLRPPAPILWAPRLRYWLNRFFTRMDRRQVRKLAAINLNVLDIQWRRAYHTWWVAKGWAEGAPPIENLAAARAYAARSTS